MTEAELVEKVANIEVDFRTRIGEEAARAVIPIIEANLLREIWKSCDCDLMQLHAIARERGLEIEECEPVGAEIAEVVRRK